MRTEALFDLLDTELSSVGIGIRSTPLPGLSADDIKSLRSTGNDVAALATETTDKEYAQLHRHSNVLSNSICGELHACPRRLILQKISANTLAELNIEKAPNLDFVFGHAVGAGVQAYLTWNNLELAQYAAFLSWRADFTFGHEDWAYRKKKTIERALFAVESFAYRRMASDLEDWELYHIEGRPAIEMSFCIDFGKYKYFGHIDSILRNKRTGRIAVGELKTSGFTNPDEALYRNSGQALGYSLVLDAIVGELADYDVIYMAYSAPSQEWVILPFAKSIAQKLEWVQDRLIDSGHMEQYYKLRHFPKRGESCMQFNRRCAFYGECDLVDKDKIEQLPELNSEDKDTYPVDYYFNLQEIIGRQTINLGE